MKKVKTLFVVVCAAAVLAALCVSFAACGGGIVGNTYTGDMSISLPGTDAPLTFPARAEIEDEENCIFGVNMKVMDLEGNDLWVEYDSTYTYDEESGRITISYGDVIIPEGANREDYTAYSMFMYMFPGSFTLDLETGTMAPVTAE